METYFLTPDLGWSKEEWVSETQEAGSPASILVSKALPSGLDLALLGSQEGAPGRGGRGQSCQGQQAKAVKEGPLLTLLRGCVLSRGLGPLSQQSQALKGELSLGPGARSFCWFPLCQKMPWNPGPGPLPWRTWFYFLICTGKVGPVTPPDPQVSTRTDQLAFKSLQLEAQGSVHRGLHAESTSLLLLVLP